MASDHEGLEEVVLSEPKVGGPLPTMHLSAAVSLPCSTIIY